MDARTERKPRIGLQSVRHLAEIDRYIRQYNIRGRLLYQAASDVLDGAVNRCEISDLIRRKLVTIDSFDDPSERPEEWGAELCGGRWTVALTDRAMKAFWPERMKP